MINETGHALLQIWAEKRAQSVEATYVPAAGIRSHGKKAHWRTTLGCIIAIQQCFLRKKHRGKPSQRIRPFEEQSRIENRGWSKRCQRLMTDFEAEESFVKAAKRTKVYRHHLFGHKFAQIAPLSSFAGNSRQAIFEKLDSNNEVEKLKFQ